MKFEGVYTAIITPFKNQGKEIDFAAYEKLIERQVAAGVSGIVPCGTTGESPTLSHDEHSQVIKRAVEIVKGRIQVIAGTGSNSTAEAVRLTEAACKDGVDAVMLVNPYYNKPSQEGLFLHFKTIAEASAKPVVVYNIKGRTAVNLEVETLKRLGEVKNILAVKEASGDLLQMIRVLHETKDRFSLLSGDDNLIPAVMGIGGKGVISVASNLYPARMVRMMNLYLQGKTKEANEEFYGLLDLMQSMFWETNPVPVKHAASLLGLCEPHLRLPLVAMKQDKIDALKKVIDQTGADV